MDMLKERAEIFKNLLNVEYRFILGRKKTQTHLCLYFDKIHFFHLVGLQYLKDRPQLSRSREKVFNNILDGVITYDQISSSMYFPFIEKRFMAFVNFERFLDDNGLVFKFNHRAKPWDLMKAKYILENTVFDDCSYIFIDEKSDLNKFFCRSFFLKEKDYTVGHTRYTLLYKEKVCLQSHNIFIQCENITTKHE